MTSVELSHCGHDKYYIAWAVLVHFNISTPQEGSVKDGLRCGYWIEAWSHP